jgi:serine phosphatase RsbU (regulator of sigma subunit)
MELNKKIINRFLCKFRDIDLEQDYKIYANEKSKKFNYRLLIIVYFIGLFVIIDDILTTGFDLLYVSWHLFAQILFWIMFLSSEDFKKKYYEKYFFITWVGFMNAGAYLYYFSPEPFPAGEGVITSSILFSFTIYPLAFVESIVASIATSIPMAIMLFHKENIDPGHLIYQFMMPFGLLIYFKFSNEILKRSDFLNEKIAKSKQKEINDSINYAKKIQEAMLVSEKYLKETLPKSFIFYQPKDIVSGDFYWAHKNESNIFFSVSDCTGHGVPGALMSMIGTTLLNEIIVEMKYQETDKILNEMRKQIIKNLNQEESNNQRDGMDMTLVKLNLKKKEIEFSSANNVLVHVSDGNLNSYKGDHQPVGFYSGKNISFTKQKVKVNKDDMIYIFSDGYQDQFGGEKNKKFMISNLKKLLLKISNKNVDAQLQELKTEFELWKGNEDQIDDVCLMGLRIT